MKRGRPDQARVVVHKMDAAGREVWSYPARLLAQSPHERHLEAVFDRQDGVLGGLSLRRGDRFLETFYSNRWFSVFAIYDVQTGEFKGWYCNFSRPARFEPADIYAEDLALDLIVFPDGREVVLDDDEYKELELSDEEQEQVERAMKELRELAGRREPPFDADFGARRPSP
jgi:predicted RNA-binding protein associated with RNAse of E/G family